jgi:uroporphyrin-III C-methyltransferase
MTTTGKVFLVGAGPGDPELITLKGVNALRQADVVMYDRLAHPDLLNHAPAHAARVYVGKLPGKGGTPKQELINKMLIEFAQQGKTVVRLKGGDPFVFGRGGEEAIVLNEAGIPFEVVPGISSAIAVAEAALIPVTHRHMATAFAVFAGHEANDGAISTGASGTDWELAARIPTAVFLMGVERLPIIVRELIAHGRKADTPVALIENGSLPEQRVIVGTLSDIVAKAVSVQPPATVIVGEVVSLRERMLNHAVIACAQATAHPV